MPKAAKYRVDWSESETNYQLHYPDGKGEPVTPDDFQKWSEWLKICPSFSFSGQNGSLNLLKEKRGEDIYCYAYRRRGQEVLKKYAGRVNELSISRLEELAQLLNQSAQNLSDEKDQFAQEIASSKDVPQKNSIKFDAGLLLAPKLNWPRLHSGLIQRERLLNWLDYALERKLTVIAAPAGYGKTTLVRQWIENRTLNASENSIFQKIGWLSLDANDNDPSRFWHYFIAACQIFKAGFGEHSLAALQAFTQPPFEPQSWETILTNLLNELSQLEKGGILVLEDFHNISSPYINQSFEFLVDHLPPQFHLIIISRIVLFLPLARWRAINELGELSRADLRFQPAETKLFLEQNLQLTMSVEAVERLDQKLEGWVVGLRLIALALHGRLPTSQIAGYLENFEITNQRTILEYFVSEVLKAQPLDLQDFLLRTSLLDQLTGPLCDVVTSRVDSEKLLEYLADTNLFLDVSDVASQWYRYHALFAEAMRYEAKRRLGAKIVEEVLERAGQWYEQQGKLNEAIEAFLAARQASHAAELIEQFIKNQPRGGMKALEINNTRRWVEQLPEEILNEHPNIQFNYALALLFEAMTGPFAPASLLKLEQSLGKAEVSFRAANNLAKLGEVMAFRSLLVIQNGDLKQVVEYATKALEWLPPNEVAWRSWSMGVLGSEAYYRGDFATARQQLLEARALGEIEGNRVYQRANAGMLCSVLWATGESQQAVFYINYILREAREDKDPDDIAHAQAGLAHVSYEWNKLDETRQQAEEALELAQQLNESEVETAATLMLARIDTILGQPEAASKRISNLLAQLQPNLSPNLNRLYHYVKSTRVWFYLQTGEITLAEQWRQNLQNDEKSELPLLEWERDAIMAARVLIAHNQSAEALKNLQTLLKSAEAGERRRNAVEIKLLLALAHYQLNELENAVSLVKEVALFAKTQGYVRLFLDEGPNMEKLLTHIVKTVSRDKSLANYLKMLLQAFNPTRPPLQTANNIQSLVEPLSRQEEKVLRLIAAGQTNPQIANELVVSVNTVRTQVQSIYRKLNVNNRQAASETARQLHLI